jgi:NTP pyrophosphatase (non-canonical NTP hydrolase)
MTPPTDRLQQLSNAVREFTRERDWEQFHDPKNLAMAIASEAGELLAEFRWVHSAEVDSVVADPTKRAKVEAEAADVMIALLGLCNRLGLDLAQITEAKLELNRVNYPIDSSRGRSERPE